MQDCPEALGRAFLDLLTWTLLQIRGNSQKAELCLALSDHMHNIPALLAEFTPERLRYYWEVERPCFLRALQRIEEQSHGAYPESWAIVEAEYRRICNPPSDTV
ncbi:hypothetical protein TA3x_002089 [Tundrisphaera sp. TA3]|uniref:hypothetical protein n=1 Tax=Tundrisphaera sp. TA3 TaxID=3435775 RepID=UPI003EBCB546